MKQDWPRLNLSVLGFGYFALYFALGLEIVLATPTLQRLGVSASDAGDLWAGRSLLSVLGPICWGYFADRSGKAAWLVRAAFLGATLCHLSMWWMQDDLSLLSFVFIALGFFVSGGVVLLDGLVLRSLGDALHRYGRVRLFGGVGFGLAASLASGLEISSNFSDRFFVGSAACFLCGGFATALLKMQRTRPAEGAVPMKTLFTHGANWTVCFLLVLIVAQWASHGLYTGFLTPAAAQKGISLNFVGYAVVAAIVMETVFLFLSARLLSKSSWRRPLLAFILLTTLLRWAMSASTAQPWIFVTLQGLHGITFGLFHAWAVFQFARIFPPQVRQTAQGWLLGMGYGLGGALGMGATGRLLENAQGPSAWFAMTGFATVAAVAGILFSLLERNGTDSSGASPCQ